jgi:hypothetical protein
MEAAATGLQDRNIRFTHDPDWNKWLFSLQAAHDGKGLFWGAVHVVAGWGVISI